MKKIILLAVASILSSFAFGAEQTSGYSTTFEYTHSNVEFDTDIETSFNGAAIGFSTSPRQHGIWGKAEFSTSSKTDSNYYEGTIGGHYNILNKGNFYLNGLAGVGYTRIDSGITDSNLNFISLPVGIEAGYSITNRLDLFANVGYKWLFDLSSKNGYFGNGSTSVSGNETSPDKYKDKVVCNNGYWYKGTASSLCNGNGGVVENERDKTLCNDGQWREGATNSGTCTASGGILEDEIKNGSLVGLKARYGNSISLGDAETPVYKFGLRYNF